MTEQAKTGRELRAPLFKPELLQAIGEGRKTQTRRVIKPQPTYTNGNLLNASRGELGISKGEVYRHYATKTDGAYWQLAQPPYGQPGDVWCLREPLHQEFTTSDADTPNGCLAVYADDQVVVNRETGRCMEYDWQRDTLTSMFMPKTAARDFVTVTGIRVERVQDISEADALAEGITETAWGTESQPGRASLDGGKTWGKLKDRKIPDRFHAGSVSGPEECFGSARHAFGNLWDSVYGEGAWAWNDWAWVYEFGNYQRDPGRPLATQGT